MLARQAHAHYSAGGRYHPMATPKDVRGLAAFLSGVALQAAARR
jgi:hypothetical protein